MSTPQDTTTTLNPGAGGDVMDESLITQGGTGVAVAKRPRVVIAGDASGVAVVDPVAADPGASPYSVPALGVALVDDSPQSYVPAQLRPLSMTTEGRLRVSTTPAQLDPDYFGDEPDYFGAQYTISTNPYGT